MCTLKDVEETALITILFLGGGNYLSQQNSVQCSEVDYFCGKFHKEKFGRKIFSQRPLVHKICPKNQL